MAAYTSSRLLDPGERATARAPVPGPLLNPERTADAVDTVPARRAGLTGRAGGVRFAGGPGGVVVPLGVGGCRFCGHGPPSVRERAWLYQT